MDHNELDDVQCSLIDTCDCPGILEHKFVLKGTQEPSIQRLLKIVCYNYVGKIMHNCNREVVVYCMLE